MVEPDVVVKRQEAVAAARLKMQEELNAQVEKHKERLRQVGVCARAALTVGGPVGRSCVHMVGCVPRLATSRHHFRWNWLAVLALSSNLVGHLVNPLLSPPHLFSPLPFSPSSPRPSHFPPSTHGI